MHTTSAQNTVFIWDFSKPKKYIYRYTKTTTQKKHPFFSGDDLDKTVSQTIQAQLVLSQGYI
ncbi:hypothetical protein M23134_01430 [Microscilla marina ATCC 23134]|uniref:Uncharacterized protein n=1 Tax=Microscilla marina ATCC 23134 TaxID=313606 RepID=A1ZJS1_MICM2|nr:hypothetical protein M23134_01430 [Microscilla marina ATCC 23134]